MVATEKKKMSSDFNEPCNKKKTIKIKATLEPSGQIYMLLIMSI